jgi:hypothetical protein
MSINKLVTYVKPGMLVPLWLLCATTAAQDRFTLGLGVQEYWDSNFARNPDVDSEHYTVAVASLAANHRFSKQQLALNLSGYQYTYDQRDDLDTDFYKGDASWRSDWSTRIKTALTWNHNAYQVDQLEFTGNDVVARDDAKAQLTLGTSKHISITAGVSQALQNHSNSLRQSLEFDEEEAFIGASYHTSNDSSLTVRVRDGERIYPYPDPNEPLSLDFDYQQRELEGVWVPTTKTRVTATVGRFEREGEVNAGVGTQSLLDASWEISEKVELSLGYSHSEPAVGETSDSPSDIRGGYLIMVWEPGSKWLISMEGRYTEQEYIQRGLEPARDETIISISPLALTYRFSESLAVRIDSRWVDRQSPLLYRDYDYAIANTGLSFRF